MMRSSVLMALLAALVASVSAVSLARHHDGATAAAMTLAPNMGANSTAAMAAAMSAEGSELASLLESRMETLTVDDFLAVPFDMNNAEDAAVIASFTRDAPAFQAWRENNARVGHHMELADFESVFAARRSSLLDLAAQLSVPVETHKTSYDALLRKVDAELSARERRAPKGAAGSFVESRAAVSALHGDAHLFRQRSTLHSLHVQDAVMFATAKDIIAALDWLVKNLPKNHCMLCKAAVARFRQSLCGTAGRSMCKTLVTLMTGPLAAVGKKFFCDTPLNLSNIFANWCLKGLYWLQDKVKLSEECLCSFSIPLFTIPAAKFTVLGVVVHRSEAINIKLGTLCPAVSAATCKPTATADSAKYKKMGQTEAEKRLAAQIAEAERVANMTPAQRKAYLKDIAAGKVKTHLDERVATQLFGPIDAGLRAIFSGGKAVVDGGKSIIDGGKAVIDGAKNKVIDGVIDGGKTVIDGGKKAIDGGKKIIDGGKSIIDAGKKAIDAGKKAIKH